MAPELTAVPMYNAHENAAFRPRRGWRHGIYLSIYPFARRIVSFIASVTASNAIRNRTPHIPPTPQALRQIPRCYSSCFCYYYQPLHWSCYWLQLRPLPFAILIFVICVVLGLAFATGVVRGLDCRFGIVFRLSDWLCLQEGSGQAQVLAAQP